MKKFNLVLIMGGLIMLFGCGGTNIDSYKDNKPVLDIRKYLNGTLSASGILKDRSGKVTKYFTVKMVGKWNGNSGTLEEEFTFDDGEKQYRTWSFEFSDDNNFTSKAHDVIGTGKGQQVGNALKMTYVLRIPYNKSTIDINMIDWIYMVNEKTLVNTTELRKFGFKVGELVVVFNK